MIICVLLFDELFKSINREDVLCDGQVFLKVEHSVGSFPGFENLSFRKKGQKDLQIRILLQV